MQIFELSFKPKGKEDVFLQSFVFEPENIYQKNLGNLYMAGELTQALPQDAHFLHNLALAIKKEYYSASLKKSPEQSLREALKQANEFLDKESKKGNVSWLGNLNFAVLSFKDPVLNFTKVGNLKIFLLRGQEQIDISQTLEAELTQPDPLRVFGTMASGKMSSGDKIVILNKSIISAFNKKQNFLQELSKIAKEKGLKQLMKTHQETLAEVSGLCLLLMVGAEEKATQKVTLHQELPKFSFHKTFIKPCSRLFSKIWRRPKIKIPSLKISKPKVIKIKPFQVPKLQLPTIPRLKFTIPKVPKKQVVLVFGLALVLVAFSFLFKGEKESELKEAQRIIEQAQAKATLAESLLILKEEDKAQTLFQEAWDMIDPLTKPGQPFKPEAQALKETIEQHLAD